MYDKIFRKLLFKGIIGIIIGLFYFFMYFDELGVKTAFIAGIVFGGLPYGWDIAVRITDIDINHNSITALTTIFFIRFYIALAIGWLAYPVALFYYIIKFKV